MNKLPCFLAASAFLVMLSALSALAQAPLAPAAPTISVPTAGTVSMIAQAQADQQAGRFADALALLQAPPPDVFPADTTAWQLALADLHSAWAKSLQDGSPEQAIGHSQAALAIDKTRRPHEAARDLLCLGTASVTLSQYRNAIDFYQQALRLYRQTGDKPGQASALNSLGTTDNSLGQYAQAIGEFSQALALNRQAGDKDAEAGTLVNWGSVYGSLCQYNKAIDFYRQALLIFPQSADREGQANALLQMGSAYDGLSQSGKAIDLFQQAWSFFQQSGDAETRMARQKRSGISRSSRNASWPKRRLTPRDPWSSAVPRRGLTCPSSGPRRGKRRIRSSEVMTATSRCRPPRTGRATTRWRPR